MKTAEQLDIIWAEALNSFRTNTRNEDYYDQLKKSSLVIVATTLISILETLENINKNLEKTPEPESFVDTDTEFNPFEDLE